MIQDEDKVADELRVRHEGVKQGETETEDARHLPLKLLLSLLLVFMSDKDKIR